MNSLPSCNPLKPDSGVNNRWAHNGREFTIYIMGIYKNIKLSKLVLNTNNDRFDAPVKNELEAINVFLKKNGEEVYQLAKDILNNKLSPKPFYVIENNGKYIIKDGNRRGTAIKLMANPKLIDQKLFPQSKKRFLHLSKSFKINPTKAIQCYICDDLAEADKWVKLEHTGKQNGVGQTNWDREESQRFNIRQGKKPKLEIQVIDLLRKSVYTDENTNQLLDKVYLTNLGRMMSDTAVREKMGILLVNGILKSEIQESEIVKGLSQLVKDISSMTVKDIYTTKKREDYLSKFPKEKYPNTNNKTNEQWSFIDDSLDTKPNDDTTPPETSNGTGNGKKEKLPNSRKGLIPKSCIINISNPKSQKIYEELTKIDVDKFTNCSAVTLRVFIEMSIDTYIERQGLLPNGALSASKCGWDLFQKVSRVCDHLSKRKIVDETIIKGIKVTTKDKNSILGIDTLHAYVHNNQFAPTAEYLKTTWDNIQEFMVTLWSNIETTE